VTTWLVLAALAAGEGGSASGADAPAKPVPEMVREILADKKFEFCHDPHYQLTPEEAKMCVFVVQTDAACPAFADVCKPGPGATRVAPPKKVDLDLELPSLGGIPRALLLLVVALAIAFVVYMIVQNIRPGEKKPDLPDEEEDAAPTPEAVPQEVESDVDRLLARARAAAAAGDYARAIMDLHAALLRRLEGAGLVTVHPSRTNGDYVRAVAGAKPGLAAPVRSIVTDVERVQYGDGTASADLFAALLARVQLVTLDKLMVLVLAAAAALGAGSCNPQRPGPEYSPSGRVGVYELLRRAGRQVKERFVPVSRLKKGDTDALVLLPGANLNDADWAAVQSWVGEHGGTLVLAGVPEHSPSWLGTSKPDDRPGPALNVVGTPAYEREHGHLELPLPPSPMLAVGSEYQRLLMRGTATSHVYAAERSYQEGQIVALADDRLFTNGALPFGDNARALIILLSGTTRIDLVGELTGFAAPNPVATVTRSQLLPFLLQLIGLTLVFFLFRGVAFGKLREPPPPRRRSFVEHVEAVGQQYARARAARHVLASYGLWVIERLRERVALPAGSGFIALADAVAVRTGKSPGEVMRLLMEAREVPALAAPASAEDVVVHLAAVRSLGELLVFRSRRETDASDPGGIRPTGPSAGGKGPSQGPSKEGHKGGTS
jgi:hypothetical protein